MYIVGHKQIESIFFGFFYILWTMLQYDIYVDMEASVWRECELVGTQILCTGQHSNSLILMKAAFRAYRWNV